MLFGLDGIKFLLYICNPYLIFKSESFQLDQLGTIHEFVEFNIARWKILSNLFV